MARKRMIRISDDETSPEVICAQIEAALKKIRREKLARDLIGDDERSAEFEVVDFELFAEELSEGVELTSRDRTRAMRRAHIISKNRRVIQMKLRN